MAKKKVCKKCRLFVEGGVCPICKGNIFSTNWQGRLFINNVEKSMIAEKVDVKVKGEYTIKVK